MPKRTDIKKIMVTGSGSIIIGQAVGFDCAGTQACLAFKEKGYSVVLVDSNPATIMTDEEIAGQAYIEPLTLEFITRIIHKEHLGALLPTLEGQTGLNMATELSRAGILDEPGVESLDTKLLTIDQAEDRDLFEQLMGDLNQPVPEPKIVSTIGEVAASAKSIGYPVIVRPAFTLGSTGGGICDGEEELRKIAESGLRLSPVTQCSIERFIVRFEEIEYEAMRDAAGNALMVCNAGNFDLVGIHTEDSVVFVPTQTLSDIKNQMLRDVSLSIIHVLKIEGGCSVQLALDSNGLRYYAIGVSPRVLRSSAPISRAAGYPTTKLAARTVAGLTLDEMVNPVTGTTYAMFEPALDYMVTKTSRSPFDEFENGERHLGTQMRTTDEITAIGCNTEESFLKACHSLEISVYHNEMADLAEISDDELVNEIVRVQNDRLFYLFEVIRHGYTIEELSKLTKIDLFFPNKLFHIFELKQELVSHVGNIVVLKETRHDDLIDYKVAELWNMAADDVCAIRAENKIIPVYKVVDACVAELKSATPYFYSTYEWENGSVRSDKKPVIVLGLGPIRIGQGIEFGYTTAHPVKTTQIAGCKAIIVNSNPEMISTDFLVSDRPYSEPLTFEDTMSAIELGQPEGVAVQFGGQAVINLAESLSKAGVIILDIQVVGLDRAEDHDLFEQALKELDIPQPLGQTVTSEEEAVETARKIGFSVLVRPSYILGRCAMETVENEGDLRSYMHTIIKANPDHLVLVDPYAVGRECEVDAIFDGKDMLIPEIMEHIGRAGTHSGDSITVYPLQTSSRKIQDIVADHTKRLAIGLNCFGMTNIQFVIKDETVYVIEVNPRAGRTVPFLSKVINILMARVTAKSIPGQILADLGYEDGLYLEPDYVYAKAPVFSFIELAKIDSLLGPEMKSTGRVMGSDQTLGKALYKASEASYFHLPSFGNIVFTVSDGTKEEALGLARHFVNIRYSVFTTQSTAKYFAENGLTSAIVNKSGEDDENDIPALVRTGKVQAIANTVDTKRVLDEDGVAIYNSVIEHGIPLFTVLDAADAMIRVLESRGLTIQAI